MLEPVYQPISPPIHPFATTPFLQLSIHNPLFARQGIQLQYVCVELLV